jgi:hypothetical protein
MMRLFVLFAVLLCGSGCATVTRGTSDQVQIQSSPSGATVRTSLGHSCVTPCTITVNRKDEFVVTFTKHGFQTVEIPVRTAVQMGGGGAFAGNILAGGIVGMGADLATGAANDHVPNPVIAELMPDRPGAPPPVRPEIRAPQQSSQPAPRAPAVAAQPAPSPAATPPIASNDSLRN